jgi:CHAT domain-containing protein
MAETAALREHAAVLKSGSRDAARASRQKVEAARAKRADVVERMQEERRGAGELIWARGDTLAAVREDLQEGDLLVTFWLDHEEGAAVLVTSSSETILDLGPTKEIEADVTELLASRNGEIDDSALESLRRRLASVTTAAAKARRIVVVPDGVLAYVPFALLVSDRPVVAAPSATIWRILRRGQAALGRGVLGVGDPRYESGDRTARSLLGLGTPLGALPGTRAEVEAVADVRLLGPEATEERLHERLAERERWRAVHVACHGEAQPDAPHLSSLALTAGETSDGHLTASEISESRVPADLVVLSACETAVGPDWMGESLGGLVRSFLLAGASGVLASLWQVDDDATAELMRRFYDEWNPKGEGTPVPAAEALRRAQAAVRANPKWAHPRFWAAWTLWGSGT